MLNLLLPSIAFTILFYLFRRLPTLIPTSTRLKGLPTHRLTQPSFDPSSSGWNVEFGRLTISIWTAAANHLPGWIVTRRGSRGQAAWKRGYDLGGLLGVLGGGVGTLGAVWAVGAVWAEVWVEVRSHAEAKGAAGGMAVIKRALYSAAATAVVSGPRSGGGGLQPIIPGVTVPLSHLPTLALALLLNQLIHELGHAIAAALDDVPMSRLSFNLHICVPSTTVTFPSSVDFLPTRAKIRLATSGPFHNLVLYLSLWILASSGLGRLFWRNRSNDGVVVQSVQPMSPLFDHFSPGDLVTHIDDVFLGEQGDIWTSYLSGKVIGDEGRGWCVDRAVFMSMSSPPCSLESGTVVFEPVEIREGTTPKCLATHPVLHIPSSACPCPSNKWVCVHPSHDEEIMRIRLASSKKDQGTDGVVVLFAGDRREVLESVTVGDVGARFAGGLIRWYTMFLEYMSTIALSLFLINLLPLPHTDGSSLLRSLLHLYRSRNHHSSSPPTNTKPLQATLSNGTPSLGLSKPAPSINLSRQYELNSDDEDEYGEEGRGRGRGGGAGGGGGGGGGGGVGEGKKEEAWKRRIRRGVEAGMVGLVLAWAAGWGMLALLRSS